MEKCEQRTVCSVSFITHFLANWKGSTYSSEEKKKIKKAGFLGQTFHKALDVHLLTGRLSTGRLLNWSLMSTCF